MTSLFKDMNTLTADMHRESNFSQLGNGLREHREHLPTPVRPKAQDWRSVLTDHDFNAPDDNYDRVWFDTASREPGDLNNFAHRLVEVFWKVHGTGQDDLPWPRLEECA